MVPRTVAVAYFFLIFHLVINYFSVIGYFFSPDYTPHVKNSPSKSLERDNGSSVGEINVIVELAPTSHVPIAQFSPVGSSGMLMSLLMFPSWSNIQFLLIPSLRFCGSHSVNGGVNSSLVPMFNYSSWIGFLVGINDTIPLISSGSLMLFSLK